MRLAATVVIVVGCGHAAPTAKAPAEEAGGGIGMCAAYAYMGMGMEAHSESDGGELVTAVDDAQAFAQNDYDAAVKADEAHHPREAARHFLDCAHRFLNVPADDPMLSSAVGEAQVCYYDAIYAFANAGAFVSEGKAALEAAATADARNAAYIRGELAKPPSDCDQTNVK